MTNTIIFTKEIYVPGPQVRALMDEGILMEDPIKGNYYSYDHSNGGCRGNCFEIYSGNQGRVAQDYAAAGHLALPTADVYLGPEIYEDWKVWEPIVDGQIYLLKDLDELVLELLNGK